MSTAIGDKSGIATNNGNLGSAYRNLGEYEKSIDYIKTGLEMSTAIGYKSGIATNNTYLGMTYHSLGEYEKAIDYFKKGLEISTVIGDKSVAANNNANLGITYHSLGEYAKAIDYGKKGLETSTAIGDNLEIARNSGVLGKAYLNLGEYEKAIDYCKKGLEMSTAVDNKSGIANNNENLGDAYLILGEYEKAIDYFKKSVEMSADIGQTSAVASNNSNLGIAYLKIGDFEKAIDSLKTSLEMRTVIGDKLGIAKTCKDLANAYLGLRDDVKTIDYCEKCLELSRYICDKEGIASWNGNLGDICVSFGEYEKAIYYYKKGLEMSTAIGDKSGIATSNVKLGIAYRYLREFAKAIDYLEKGLEISTIIGDKSGIADANGGLGIAHIFLGEYEKSIDCQKKCLEISTAIDMSVVFRCLGQYEKSIHYSKKSLEMSTAIGNKSAIAKSYCHLGSAYHSFEEYEKAIDCFRKGLEISTGMGDKSAIATQKLNLGSAYLGLGEYEKAIDYYKKALEISIDINDPSLLAISKSNLGFVLVLLGQYKGAISCFMESISILDKMFLNSVPDQNKLSFTKQYFTTHVKIMICFISVGRIESALLVIDLGRAKELHCSIERKNKSLNTKMFDYASSGWNRIKNGEEQVEIEDLQSILQVSSNDSSIIVFAFDWPGFLNVWVLNKEVIFRYRVSKSEARLEKFVQLISELFRMVNVNVNRDSSFFELNSVPSIDEKSILPLDVFKEKSPSKNLYQKPSVGHDDLNQDGILKTLFKLLIDPVSDVIKGNKLIVVADKQLFFVPFSSLIDENGCHLSHNYSIQVTPSLHTLRFSIERSQDLGLGFALFVGNPTVGTVSLNGKEFSPPALPNAAREVECLSKLFNARPLVGREARKQVVLDLLSGASIIHIAAHGEQLRGEIMLSPNVSSTRPFSTLPYPDDYLLSQKDIVNTSLLASLVVLCCCHTGQGEISSEGVIGIARAFIAAGARTVLATLWPISDDATKEFMEVFYGELCQGTSVCEALRKTKNLFQKHQIQAYRSYKIWAPFTIYGEDVVFQKHDIENIRDKSRDMFSGFVVLP
ncbi:tetratricopeptide repeat protein 28-like [Dendronephthya gigantea]|uniref:tetratricopeptide repeat protein 28-like n=1 Tax=Dendronephthya gigantea TaxID=151771 RepID=UPI00106A5FAA|nr:tetratricopeptide repeat protein 28-like [Dendronephthya gigantea]